MARSARRSAKQSGGFSTPVILAALFVVALLLACSSFVIVAHYEELQVINGAGRHEQFKPPKLPENVASGTLSSESSHSLVTHSEAMDAIRSRALTASQEKGQSSGSRDSREQPKRLEQQVPASSTTKAAASVDSTSSSNRVVWKKHVGKSCQNYVETDVRMRSLEDAKSACLAMDACVAIECPTGQENDCTLRAIANLVDYTPADCYEELEINAEGKIVSTKVHPDYNMLLKEYPFQQVTTQTGNQVNVILVRSQMSSYQIQLYEKYKNDILFLGISSMNDYPLNEKVDYLGMFPGFLHMMHDPEKHFPPHVKTLLMSQSDFSLPDFPERDYSVPRKYDFTYSASDCDVHSDGNGWCGWSKNWSFVKSVLPIMCEEFKLTGVLVATKDKSGRRAYTIPESCKGRMTQTTYLANQGDYFHYLKQSRFAFLPQIHDASPRVSTQALALDVPIFMNYYIQGGWKYVNDKTGEFFHDQSDFREKLRAILRNSDIPKRYEPRKWVLDNYGNEHSGKRLYDFVMEHFSHRVKLPKGTKRLLA
jgi:hypothetical protein